MQYYLVSSGKREVLKTFFKSHAKNVIKQRESWGEFCQLIEVNFNDMNLIYQTTFKN